MSRLLNTILNPPVAHGEVILAPGCCTQPLPNHSRRSNQPLNQRIAVMSLAIGDAAYRRPMPDVVADLRPLASSIGTDR